MSDWLQHHPDWIRKNPDRNIRRIQEEGQRLAREFPYLRFYRAGDTLFLEGPVASVSGNLYVIRVRYGANYPYEAPAGFVLDEDVIEYASRHGNHQLHNYGREGDWGLRLCTQASGEWRTIDSAISMVQYTIAWINAYEYFQCTGRWLLKE